MFESELLITVAKGVVMGAIAGILGYAKNVGEDFELGKFAQTLIIGGFVGGYGAYTGVEYVEAFDYLSGIGAITLLEYVKKTIWRRLLKPLLT